MSELLAGLSAINAGLQITNQYLTDKKADDPNALSKALFNGAGAFARIGMADHMAQHGNYFGYTLNSFVPYTDTRANAFALGASMMPWGGGFGCGGFRPFMSFGGAGFMPWGGGFGFGGGFHHHHHCHGGRSTIIIRA